MSKAKDKAKKITEEDLPELKQYRIGQRVVSVMVGLGLMGVAIAKTVLYALRGRPDKAVSNVRKAIKSFVGTVDPDAKSKKKGKEEEVSLGRKLFRIFSGAAVLGLGVAGTVFKALRGDITGVVGDLGDIVTLGAEVVYGIIPFFGSKVKEEPKAPGIFSKLIAKVTGVINNVIDFAKSTVEKLIKRMEESPAGRAMLRMGEAGYDIATSEHVKVAFQFAIAVMTLVTATTPLGWAVAALSLGAVVGSGIKSLLHARSLRLLNEKKDCLISLQKERDEQLRLLEQNPALRKLHDKARAVDSQGMLGEKPQRPPIDVRREVFSAVASSVVGGAAAILEAIADDPTKQAATAFVLLGGVSKEVKGNIKKEISRLDLKEEIWKLGGGDKSLNEVQAGLLESKKRTMALTLLAADIERTKSTGKTEERFDYFMQKAAEVHVKPSLGDRIKGGFKGFVKDCNTLLFGDIRKGGNKLMGRKEDEPKPSKIPEAPNAVPASRAQHQLKSKAPDVKNEVAPEVKQRGRVTNIVEQIEAKQRPEPKKKETGVARNTPTQTEVKMKVAALETAQEVINASARKVAKDAREHVAKDTNAKVSRNQKQGSAIGRHKVV